MLSSRDCLAIAIDNWTHLHPLLVDLELIPLSRNDISKSTKQMFHLKEKNDYN
jgi:hypothetical protein